MSAGKLGLAGATSIALEGMIGGGIDAVLDVAVELLSFEHEDIARNVEGVEDGIQTKL